jgi:hypothetical protein
MSKIFDNSSTPSSPDNIRPATFPDCTSPDRAEVADALSFLCHLPPALALPHWSAAPMLTMEQLQEIIVQLTDSIKVFGTHTSARDNNPFCSEHYISQGLSSKFDGTQEILAPWIKKFKSLGANALWRETSISSPRRIALIY